MIHNTNPVFNLPDSVQLAEAIRTVPMVVAMASFIDETSILADIILPTDTYLEAVSYTHLTLPTTSRV